MSETLSRLHWVTGLGSTWRNEQWNHVPFLSGPEWMLPEHGQLAMDIVAYLPRLSATQALSPELFTKLVEPPPATPAILIELKAGESVYQADKLRKTP